MYNPLYGMLFRLLGEAAARKFVNEEGRSQDPFDGMFNTAVAQEDDSPINVEAEVIDSDGKTQTERIHEEWNEKRQAQASHQLQGNVVFEGSRNYNILVGVLSALLFVGGVVVRIYSLVMGCIFSSVVVPVALGAIPGLIFVIAGIVLIWRKGAWKMPFCAVDLLLVFFSAALMGYGNIIPAVCTTLICWAYMKAREGKKPPYIVPYAVIAAAEAALVSFPGLWV